MRRDIIKAVQEDYELQMTSEQLRKWKEYQRTVAERHVKAQGWGRRSRYMADARDGL